MPSGSLPQEFSKQKQDEDDGGSRKRGAIWHNDVHEKIQTTDSDSAEEKGKIDARQRAEGSRHDAHRSAGCDMYAGRKKGICWEFILGNCPRGKRCKFVHPPAKKLPESFVTKALPPLTKLAKGLEQVASQSERREVQEETPIEWG